MENITGLLQPYISLSEFIQILVSCISLAIALGSLYQSKKSIQLTENSILSANRPYVVIYIETLDTVYFERYIVIKNFGKSAARILQSASLKENMDTKTSTGKAMFQMMCVIAELERNLIAERVKEGLEASKKRGKTLGRPKLDKEKLTVALRMYDSKEYSVKEIVSATGISQGSLYRAINRRKLGEIN
ncbi:recombinase family protein [Enterococcus faecium]|uniref:recombinase family protein n=1 Tax=Enterococcus faecium TaxID=1352 RepID=UPI001C3721D3|nr:recombinase family protein [Enterococcus faecium]MDT6429657.1 recombinase family protein [Enterococcus faecium]MDT6432320.1 recombinase family protein [Enterococcus faecium]MDT6451406.1 recombinase family protein [Enterococcus faecium]MDV4497872.1 recombinase family protein [Enterococcus faecium]